MQQVFFDYWGAFVGFITIIGVGIAYLSLRHQKTSAGGGSRRKISQDMRNSEGGKQKVLGHNTNADIEQKMKRSKGGEQES